MKKKISIILLALVMVLSLCPCVMAEEAAPAIHYALDGGKLNVDEWGTPSDKLLEALKADSQFTGKDLSFVNGEDCPVGSFVVTDKLTDTFLKVEDGEDVTRYKIADNSAAYIEYDTFGTNYEYFPTNKQGIDLSKWKYEGATRPVGKFVFSFDVTLPRTGKAFYLNFALANNFDNLMYKVFNLENGVISYAAGTWGANVTNTEYSYTGGKYHFEILFDYDSLKDEYMDVYTRVNGILVRASRSWVRYNSVGVKFSCEKTNYKLSNIKLKKVYDENTTIDESPDTVLEIQSGDEKAEKIAVSTPYSLTLKNHVYKTTEGVKNFLAEYDAVYRSDGTLLNKTLKNVKSDGSEILTGESISKENGDGTETRTELAAFSFNNNLVPNVVAVELK